MPEIKSICDACQKERKLFSEDGFKHSPACAQLWQLAFKKDDDAWNCVKTIFEPWVMRLCSVAIAKAPAISGLSRDDVADVVQDIWYNLLRFAVGNPTKALELLAQDDISRVMGLVKTTVKNRVIEIGRKPRGYTLSLPDDNSADGDKDGAGTSEFQTVEPSASEPILDILDFLKKHIRTAQELIIAEIIFLQEMKPQDVFDLYPTHFKSVDDVNQCRQTLIRRMRNDPARRNFDGSASLQFRLAQDEVRMDISEPCPYDEGILLDYLNGHLELQLRQAIERSPACMAAATALSTDIEAWQPALRQMFCPTGERLVDYQERRLTGTNYLVVHKHVQNCPHCRAEIEMLSAIDSISAKPEPSLAHRIYQLIFQPATLAPIPIRGEGSYKTIDRTPQIELFVRSSRVVGKQRTWMLFGRLRFDDDRSVFPVDSVVLHPIEDEEAESYTVTVQQDGTFIFKGLSSGIYQLRIVISDEEIVLNRLSMGEDD